MKTALTIAGSDSCGGAGIQADIKTMTMNGVYAMSAVTALTAQNTTGVRAITESSPEFLKQQIDAVFEDIFRKYTTSAEIESVRTVNLGTMYQLSYEINLKDPRQEKNMIDEIRVRNGNLAVISGTHASVMSEL